MVCVLTGVGLALLSLVACVTVAGVAVPGGHTLTAAATRLGEARVLLVAGWGHTHTHTHTYD